MRKPGPEKKSGASAAAEHNAGDVDAAENADSPENGAVINQNDAGARIAELQQQLAQTQNEAAEHLSRLARVQADYENFRRRAQREREDVEQYANLALVRDILPAIDNLERALAAAIGTIDTGAAGGQPSGSGDAGLRTGVDLILRQFRDILAKAGVEPVPGAGEPFDPNYHEAVVRVDGEDEVPTVVEEFQKGYRMGSRLVRPSMVKVASRS